MKAFVVCLECRKRKFEMLGWVDLREYDKGLAESLHKTWWITSLCV